MRSMLIFALLKTKKRESRDYKNGVPNYVVACLTFVVTDRAHAKGGHHGRRVVKVPIKFNGQAVTHVTTVYPFTEKVKQKKTYSRSPDFKADLISDSPAEKHERIQEYYGKGTNSFSDSYHHSERALWAALRKPEMLMQIVEALFTKTVKGAKVYCAVLDLHSTRYLCSECEPSCHIVQKKMGKFFVELTKQLQARFALSEKNGLTLLTRVSAEDEGKRSRKIAQNHVEFWRNRDIHQVRQQRINLILQRDDRTTGAGAVHAASYGLFVSSQKLNAPQPVYIAHRTDNATSALELTASCAQFMQHIQENVQHVKDLLAECAKVRMAAGDPAICNGLLERAYALRPDDLAVWIEQFNVFEYSKRIIEKLDLCIRIFKRVLQEQGAQARDTKFLHGRFHGCFVEAYELLFAGNAEAQEHIKRSKTFLDLHESDFFQLYLLRSLYFAKEGDQKAALRDAEKALAIMKVEHLPNQSEFSWYIDFTKAVIQNVTGQAK